MLRRREHDRIDVFTGQELGVVTGHEWVGIAALVSCLLDDVSTTDIVCIVDIASCDNLGVAVQAIIHKATEVTIGALSTQADEAKDDTVIGADHTTGCHHGALREDATLHVRCICDWVCNTACCEGCWALCHWGLCGCWRDCDTRYNCSGCAGGYFKKITTGCAVGSTFHNYSCSL